MSDIDKQVRDIMIDVFEFPHVPYWFTLRQVSGILKKSLAGGKCLRPLIVLVFDEKYNLMGHLEARNILNGIGEVLFPVAEDTAKASSAMNGQQTSGALKEYSEKPASALMHPARFFVDPYDPINKAAEIMFRHHLEVIPVLEHQKKLVGLVRPLEIFEEFTRVFFST